MRQPILWIVLVAVLLPLTINAQDNPHPYNRFGIVEGFWFPQLTCDLGVGWERIIFDWAQHQPTSPTDWHTLNVDDRWLKAANQCNREVVALLKNTPVWATTGIAGAGVPAGLYLPVDDPDNHWANFVRQTARYYASRGVHRFIIWNEPDISRETYGFEFEGSLDDYFQMVKIAYLAAKQGNPAAQIHLAGTTYWHDINAGERIYLDRLLERITQDDDAPQHNYYFDAISLHIYFRTDTIYQIVQEARTLLDGYGLTDHAIWINETNAPPTQDPAWEVVRPVFQYTLEQQAAFMIHAGALSIAAGAERTAAYKLYDQDLPPGGETFGLLRPNDDQSPRPAFDAWHTVTTLLSGVESAALAQTDTADVVLMRKPDGEQVVVAWARTDTGAVIQFGTGNGDIYHYLNGGSPRDDLALNTPIPLAAAICNGDDPSVPCPVGGEPVIIVLSDDPVTVHEIADDSTMVTLFEP